MTGYKVVKHTLVDGPRAAVIMEQAIDRLGSGLDPNAFCAQRRRAFDEETPAKLSERSWALSVRRALLQRMAPEHKFSTAAKLCADVLGGAADGGLDLTAAAEVVGDALRLLASKHMKVRRDVRAAVCASFSRVRTLAAGRQGSSSALSTPGATAAHVHSVKSQQGGAHCDQAVCSGSETCSRPTVMRISNAWFKLFF